MAAVQKSLRIPEETARAIQQMAAETGRDFSAITKDLLEEALKMRHCPGIVFADGVTGRRARLAGTGIEVWEIIAVYRSVDQQFNRLKKAYHWLSDQQLKAAIGYYKAYTSEIDLQIDRNESWTPETIDERYPFLGRENP